MGPGFAETLSKPALPGGRDANDLQGFPAKAVDRSRGWPGNLCFYNVSGRGIFSGFSSVTGVAKLLYFTTFSDQDDRQVSQREKDSQKHLRFSTGQMRLRLTV